LSAKFRWKGMSPPTIVGIRKPVFSLLYKIVAAYILFIAHATTALPVYIN